MGVWGKVADLPPQRGRTVVRPTTLGTFFKGTSCKARGYPRSMQPGQLAGLAMRSDNPASRPCLRVIYDPTSSHLSSLLRRYHLSSFSCDVTPGFLLRVEPTDTPVFWPET